MRLTKKLFKRLLFLFTSIVLITTNISPTVFAFTDSDFFSQNDILYYNPGAVNNGSNLCGKTETIDLGGNGFDRLKAAVKKYGQKAMDMQREFGTPWEMVLAQMQKESSVGTAGIAVKGATNNWLGITGEGDAGSYKSSPDSKHTWAVYSSVEVSIEDWAGFRVLRNGYYDSSFKYLDFNNYNIDSFVKGVIEVYAPSSDGNNPSTYADDVLSFINGPIKEAREEMGWPSSEELAKNESIPIGGQHPLGDKNNKDQDKNNNTGISNCIGNGDINSTAILYSWPDRTHAIDDPKPEYKNALKVTNLINYGDAQVRRGSSCDAFVTAVMRTTVDPDFFCCGTAGMHAKLQTNKKYEKIPNLKNTSNLLPGDIFIIDGHVMMYVVLDDGTEKIAAASYGDRTADHYSNVFYSDSRGTYDIFRYKG